MHHQHRRGLDGYDSRFLDDHGPHTYFTIDDRGAIATWCPMCSGRVQCPPPKAGIDLRFEDMIAFYNGRNVSELTVLVDVWPCDRSALEPATSGPLLIVVDTQRPARQPPPTREGGMGNGLLQREKPELLQR